MLLVITGCGSKQKITTTTAPVTIVQTQPESNSKECGDGVCGLKETYTTCQKDCISTCGDNVVQDNENWKNCRYDLRHSCGNQVCESWEHYQYCPEDCAACIVDIMNRYNGPNECPPNPRWVG
jgi:hypothetical protein